MSDPTCETETLRTGRLQRLHAELTLGAATCPVIIVLHGLGDYGGRYRAFARQMQQRGYSTLLLDLPGHGRSPQDRRRDRTFEGLMDDIAAVRRSVADRLPQAKQILLGHSMGGNLALNYALRTQRRSQPSLQGLVLCAPMVLPPQPPPRPHIFAAWLTGHLFPWLSVQRRVDPDKLTGDQSQARAIAADPHMHGRITIYLATQLLSQGRWALDHARQLQPPTLILVGQDDELIDRSACEHLAIRVGAHARLQQFPETRHDLFHERTTEAVISAIAQWIEETVT